MTQEAVAARMWTTKSVVSRLESGVCTRPTLSTIEKYAVAVGALVEIRVRIKR
jgi:predicted transcriptional regulator